MDINQSSKKVLNNRLALGSVQFGLPYGISNTSLNETSFSEISNILNYANKIGINTIDTAISYGKSESRHGKYGVNRYKVITKLPKMPIICHDVFAWAEEQLMDSLSRLNLRSVYGLLLHHTLDLNGPKGSILWSAMKSLKEKNLVNKIGYSIYKPDDLDLLFNDFVPDIVQTPYSIFDQRLSTSGWLDRLYNSNTEIHARSIFLQGLLLFKSSERPSKFNRWKSEFEKFDLWLEENNLTALQASICFVMGNPKISKIIVGIDNLNQLKEIISNLKFNDLSFPEYKSIEDTELLDPSLWNLL